MIATLSCGHPELDRWSKLPIPCQGDNGSILEDSNNGASVGAFGGAAHVQLNVQKERHTFVELVQADASFFTLLESEYLHLPTERTGVLPNMRSLAVAFLLKHENKARIAEYFEGYCGEHISDYPMEHPILHASVSSVYDTVSAKEHNAGWGRRRAATEVPCKPLPRSLSLGATTVRYRRPPLDKGKTRAALTMGEPGPCTQQSIVSSSSHYLSVPALSHEETILERLINGEGLKFTEIDGLIEMYSVYNTLSLTVAYPLLRELAHGPTYTCHFGFGGN
ncbi:hypothetical protein BDQ12DRAFT_740416 [Crucibulum laeve]|uniref:Uncharacterized protein n=1 Tax=Crucibulum laeve TaxID=68775 RepID=A0A5C3MRY2_9AGAR|nr:hypothetical protein BDQ12DRAFT_740416 [Crucibulum laeve]